MNEENGFYVGQTVHLTEEAKKSASLPVDLRDHLHEAFLVVKVEPVPTECDCGADTEYGQEHTKRCQSRLAEESVGHHQWVTISVAGDEQRFSGYWLEDAMKIAASAA